MPPPGPSYGIGIGIGIVEFIVLLDTSKVISGTICGSYNPTNRIVCGGGHNNEDNDKQEVKVI